ncbi:hypothetical protein COZ82_01790 [Candidatus Kaiserbacteria bacterium CG_4_8_14_3_um_filter_38_9]|uniref:Uncharacterized protein n=1 Tax=Candidatus Kaiserbacteria bacterium CG_4_8_14_3_um_filter_38_9 TaxID=1974599 RepID=A0A2M7IP00_9BACT|nr:MAG: hypothetical protein COZ82_01790 [Candidatus Kaiserbacteria bacterium CG_4_8_14_3_um_filter_38_9]
MDGNNKNDENKSDDQVADVITGNENAWTEEVNNKVEVPVEKAEVVAEITENEAGEEIIPTNVSPKSALPLKQYVIAAVMIAVIGMVLWYGLEKQERVKTGVFDKIEGLVKTAKPVATVNGIKISKEQYEKNREQIIASAKQQGLDVSDAKVQSEIDAQAIDVLVNTELLRQAAKTAGVVVTPEQIESRYQEIVTSVGGVDELAQKMTELNVDENSLRSDIEGEILIKTYLTDAVDISTIKIEESEIKTAYENASDTGASLPPLEEVASQIEAQLKAVKEQDLIKTFIETLKEKAEIEITI